MNRQRAVGHPEDMEARGEKGEVLLPRPAPFFEKSQKGRWMRPKCAYPSCMVCETFVFFDKVALRRVQEGSSREVDTKLETSVISTQY